MTTFLPYASLVLVAVGGLAIMLLDAFARDRAELALVTSVTLFVALMVSASAFVVTPSAAAISPMLTRYLACDRLGFFMDVVVCGGAALASLLAGRFAPVWSVPRRSLAAALIGGLLLGYGARVAYGCNIGAYFSGISSGSLHGWMWLPAAFAGNIVGTSLRPFFGLGVERRK